jgi:hypothetical protein
MVQQICLWIKIFMNLKHLYWNERKSPDCGLWDHSANRFAAKRFSLDYKYIKKNEICMIIMVASAKHMLWIEILTT